MNPKRPDISKPKCQSKVAAAVLAERISTDFAKLRDSLGDVKKLNQYQQLDLISLSDELNNIKHELRSQTDALSTLIFSKVAWLDPSRKISSGLASAPIAATRK